MAYTPANLGTLFARTNPDMRRTFTYANVGDDDFYAPGFFSNATAADIQLGDYVIVNTGVTGSWAITVVGTLTAGKATVDFIHPTNASYYDEFGKVVDPVVAFIDRAIAPVAELATETAGDLSALSGTVTTQGSTIASQGTTIAGQGTTIGTHTNQISALQSAVAAIPAAKKAETFTGSTNASGNFVVTFANTYAAAPNLAVSVVSTDVREKWRLIAHSTTGCTIRVEQVNASFLSLLGLDVLTTGTTAVSGRAVQVGVTER